MILNKKPDEYVVYISGAITSNIGYIGQFKHYENEIIKKIGCKVLSPVEICAEAGITDWRKSMQVCIGVLLTESIDWLILLPGYEKSEGAILEKKLCEIFDIKIATVSSFLSEKSVNILRNTSDK